eukprot:CAMPEP_0116020868 /NCGR_PEP_ID=MMETSP0321-20121206/10051_1 /TAXON_ID=163516 /ORGANISM="Leptocylindrus danicus var. danicus, Strain B650" /LENGTH=87 /DNA_ID=CAMNT_0003491637 /DNA_START=265 /DNA_END=528 /DNA_ORIENTATION=+
MTVMIPGAESFEAEHDGFRSAVSSSSHPRGEVKLRVDTKIAFRSVFDDAIKMSACWKRSNFGWIELALDMPVVLCCLRMMFTRTSYE